MESSINSMNKTKGLYTSKIDCPVCGKAFETTKVRTGSYRVLEKDSDFCVRYEGINPLFYEIFVCNHCGYAAFEDKFTQITDAEKTIIQKKISSQWSQKSFPAERTLDQALDAFKLALFELQLRKAKSSEIARACLRIAWLYRLKNDPREPELLQYALEYFNETYQREPFPVEKLTEELCIYLLAELNRRLGNTAEAGKWFGKLFNHPGARNNPSLMELARDQYQVVKDAMKK